MRRDKKKKINYGEVPVYEVMDATTRGIAKRIINKHNKQMGSNFIKQPAKLFIP